MRKPRIVVPAATVCPTGSVVRSTQNLAHPVAVGVAVGPPGTGVKVSVRVGDGVQVGVKVAVATPNGVDVGLAVEVQVGVEVASGVAVLVHVDVNDTVPVKAGETVPVGVDVQVDGDKGVVVIGRLQALPANRSTTMAGPKQQGIFIYGS